MINYWKNFLRKNLFFITIGLIVVLPVTFIASSIMKKKYKAKATIIPAQKQEQIYPAIAEKVSVVFPGVNSFKNPAHYLINIMQSRELTKRIINSLDLTKKLVNKPLPLETIVDILQKKINIRDTGSELIEITVETEDRNLSADIANEYVKQLQEFIQQDVHSSKKAQRIFIKNQLKNIKEELSTAEEALKTFKEKHKTLFLPKDIEAIILKLGVLKAQITEEELKIAVMKQQMTEEHPKFKESLAKIKALKKELEKLEGSDETNELTINKIPEQEMKLANLTRAVVVRESVYKVLANEYELARIAEAGEEIRFSVLDHAVPPLYPYRPNKKQNLLFMGVIWLVVSISISVIKEDASKLHLD